MGLYDNDEEEFIMDDSLPTWRVELTPEPTDITSPKISKIDKKKKDKKDKEVIHSPIFVPLDTTGLYLDNTNIIKVQPARTIPQYRFTVFGGED